jgi:hypothetical protein
VGYSPQCHVGVSSQSAEIRAIEPLGRRAEAGAEAGGGGAPRALAAAPAGGSPARGGGGGGGEAAAGGVAEGGAPPPTPPAQVPGAEIEALRTGDRARIHFHYCYRPEYLREGDTLLFREGRCKGVGRIVQLLAPHAPA